VSVVASLNGIPPREGGVAPERRRGSCRARGAARSKVDGCSVTPGDRSDSRDVVDEVAGLSVGLASAGASAFMSSRRRDRSAASASTCRHRQWLFPAGRRQPGVLAVQMKLRRRYMQTLGVSVKQLRRKLLELGARILHVQGSKPRDMALVVRVCVRVIRALVCVCVYVCVRMRARGRALSPLFLPAASPCCDTCVVLRGRERARERERERTATR